ncbi:MAG: class I SAM-dependent methyltransferase [Nannocystaceae bacterium]
MTGFWEAAFVDKALMWGLDPTVSATLAAERFAGAGVQEVLIPGVGYGRNARAFLERGMSVTGIEISRTAIDLARARLGLEIPIFHGSVTDMPFDRRAYGGIFCHGLLYLLDAAGREKVIQACYRQLAPGGLMIFTLLSKAAPMYGLGRRLGDDWYERMPDLTMYFYDPGSIRREFEAHGLVEFTAIDEPAHGGATLPFYYVVARRGPEPLRDP